MFEGLESVSEYGGGGTSIVVSIAGRRIMCWTLRLAFTQQTSPQESGASI
jgi:hypothetical protein